MILPISTIKCKQWFYQYQQLNVNSDLNVNSEYQQLNVNSDSTNINNCKQWYQYQQLNVNRFYQYQQLNINSDSTNINN